MFSSILILLLLILFLYCFAVQAFKLFLRCEALCFLCSVGVQKLFSSVNEHITQWKATFRLPKHDRMVYSDVNKSDTMKSCVSLLKGKKYILIMIIDDILIQLSLLFFFFCSLFFLSLFGQDVVYFKEGLSWI